MNKSPSYQFYPDLWLDKKVIRMSDAAQGAYQRLLCFMWKDSENQFSIENNDKIIAKLLGISHRKWKNYRAEIQWLGDPILIEENGMLISKRLRKEKEKQIIRSNKAKESADKRWMHSQCERIKNASNSHTTEQCFPSPTPSLNNNDSITRTREVDYQIFLSKWHEMKLCPVIELTHEIKVAILANLQQYTADEILKSIENYTEIIRSKDHYYTYNFELLRFMEYGIHQFITKQNPFEKYLKGNRKHLAQEKEPEPQPDPGPSKPQYDITAYRDKLRQSDLAKWFKKSILPLIKDRINEQHGYETWFIPLIPIEVEGRVLTLHAPDKSHAQWIVEHYTGMFIEMLSEAKDAVKAEEQDKFPDRFEIVWEVPDEFRINSESEVCDE
jgi:hypothetical protein